MNCKTVTLLLATSLLCGAAPVRPKLSSELQNAASAKQDLIRVIIQWNPNTAGSAAVKMAALGGTVVSEFKNVHSGTYLIPASALDTLSQDSDVKHISAEKKVHRKLANAAAAIGAPSAWKTGVTGLGIGVAVIDSGINTDNNLNGKGPVYSEDFTATITYGKNGKAIVPDNYGVDWYGHGQHIAGIIASNGKESTCGNCTSNFIGIAPGSNLIDLKVLNRDGDGDTSSVIAAIDRAIALKNTYNIRVINLSLGQPVTESYQDDPLCQAAEAAWQAGIVVVVAAGNDGRDNSFGNGGYGTITSPGNDPYVLTVGAMKSMGTPQASDDLIASYSSKGPSAVDHIVKPDVVAPGNQIVSLRAQKSMLPLLHPGNMALQSLYKPTGPSPQMETQPIPSSDPSVQPPDAKVGRGYSSEYFTLSGTSMAAAVVSGAVADILQANPTLTPDQVKMLLMMTAGKTFPDSSVVVDSATGDQYISYYDLFTVGAGYVNLPAALSQVLNVPTGVTAISPTAVHDLTTGLVQLNFDPSSVFSDRSVWGAGSPTASRSTWGANSVWGSSVLSGNSVIWSQRSVWGATSDTSAERSVWGASAVWSQRSVWGASTGTDSEAIFINGEQ